MAFKIGQKVVCIDPTWGSATGSMHQLKYCPHLPELHGIYTVRGVHFGSVPFIWLEEIHNPGEPFFEASKFRALVAQSTEIGMAILQEILDRENFTERKPAKVT